MAKDSGAPAWLLASKSGRCACCRTGRSRKNSALERTLKALARAFADSVFSETVARRPGLLQQADPRVKIVGLLMLLLTVAFVHNLAVMLVLYLLTLPLARASTLSLGYFLKRVWLFIPVFAGIIVLPSLFNVVKAGDPLLVLWDFGREMQLGPWSWGSSLAVTKQGLAGGALLVLRVAASVSLAVLLTLTTRWSDLLKGLRVFYVPKLFILVLSMTYRYIFLLLNLASDMFTARRSRLVGATSAQEDRRFAAASMGTLLGKSHALSDEVYAAMISRGYTGEPRTLERFQWQRRDTALALAAAAVALLAWGGELFLDSRNGF